MKDKFKNIVLTEGKKRESWFDKLARKVNPFLLPVGSVVMGLSATPQIKTLYQLKDSEGINPLFIGAVIFGLLSFIINGHVIALDTGDKSARRSQYPNLIGMIIVFVMIFYYR